MASVQIRTRISAPSVGGELAGCESDQSEVLTLGNAWSNSRTIMQGNADGTVTLYDATLAGNPANWQKLAIYVDPDNDEASALDLNVEIRVDVALMVFTVNRTAPLIFCKQAADVTLPVAGIGASTINRIRCNNTNPAAAVPANNNLKVRVLALS